VADYGQRPLRDMWSALTGQPTNDPQSDDSKACVAHMAALQVEPQARIDAGWHANEIGSAP
jgi:hypothetical protein